ncbi:MAG: CHAT domain-containing protein [Phycisphaerae bacterium]|nr:CHAT domain-containing protein [Saprospiraceae bacterium]
MEFIHYRYYSSKTTDSTMCAALILRPLSAEGLSKEGGDTGPQFVPLFEKNELKNLMRGASGGSNFLKINALYNQKLLYDLIWKPLEPMLTGIKTVYFAPSGLLHRLNLAAIPTPEGHVYGERRQLVVLGSTRQLVVPNNSNQTSTNDAYLVGGIRYDSNSTIIAYANQDASLRGLELPSTLAFQPDSFSITRGGVLDYLPATAVEVRDIAQTLGSVGIQAKVDTGYYATEEAFRQLGVKSPSPRIVHLATHGYFFPDPIVSSTRQLALSSEPIFKMSEHPMIRSGLIMAGAKQAWLTGKHPEGHEDGILTAYEISQMNLSGTELVVLSACETGLGDIVGNEGVYGLQRAFKIAGAKYLVMSLWKVDDRSTRAFMTAFYRHWLTEKQSVPQAFRSTQREMRKAYPSAYDWAGFVLIE